jgi:hypothetical protein
MYILGFPLLLIPFVIYNIVAFIFRLPDTVWTTNATTVHMMSGKDWTMTWQDILVAGSILLLWIEVIKSTRIGMRSIMDHVLSMAMFIVMLIEFLLVQQAETSAFFLLMVVCLVDVLAGFIISIRSSQRQIEIEGSTRGLTP